MKHKDDYKPDLFEQNPATPAVNFDMAQAREQGATDKAAILERDAIEVKLDLLTRKFRPGTPEFIAASKATGSYYGSHTGGYNTAEFNSLYASDLRFISKQRSPLNACSLISLSLQGKSSRKLPSSLLARSSH